MNGNTELPLIDLKELDFRYPGGFHLRIAQLSLYRGKIYGLQGLNGAGKTTLLRILALLLPVPGGNLMIDGRPRPGSSGGLTELRRRMTLVEQNPYLFPKSVRENIEYGLKVRRLDRQEIASRVASGLDSFGLKWLRDKRVDQLSAGEKQKVALARGLSLQPEILLLDEPTANVDAQSVGLIEKRIREFQRRPRGLVVWATHNLEQAYRVADEVICLLEGKIVPGTIDNLFTGEVEEEDGESRFTFGPALKAVVFTDMRGPARMLIQPDQVILSREPLESSARNCFPGTIIRIEDRNGEIAVTMDIGLPAIAVITAVSYHKLGLKVGSRVYVTFKATAARIF